MKEVALYLGAAFAAWTGLGLLCLRTVSVRTRFAWAPLGCTERRMLGGGGALFCGLSLVFLLQADPASFALVAWISVLGVLGFAMALVLPSFAPRLAVSLKLAGVATVAAAMLPLLGR